MSKGRHRDSSPVGAVVAITGGARGIGRATAARLLATGARVAIGDIDADATRDAAAALGCLGVGMDVSSPESFEAFLAAVEAELGALDVMINNAGVLQVGLYADENPEVTARMVSINLGGAMNGTRAALRRMLPRRSGHVINVASAAGKAPFPGAATYTATKFAIVGFSEAVRAETRASGIELSCVMPTLVATDMALGLKTPPGVKTVAPDDVAAAIVGVIAAPRFDVYVPRALGPMLGGMNFVPRAARERLAHLAKADEPMTVDAAARAPYLSRLPAQEARP
jgi:NADP-dependent 3-hydroxy acid dehydrogenase YdfG